MQIWFMTIMTMYLALAGCSAGAGSSAMIHLHENDVLFVGGQCGGMGNGVGADARWINTQQEYEHVFKTLHINGLGIKPPLFPEVDFSNNGVLVVDLGHKATGGYSVSLESSEVEVINETATVIVNQQKPMAGAIVPQLTTQPCLLLKMPKSRFTEIRVVDQSGAFLQVVRIP